MVPRFHNTGEPVDTKNKIARAKVANRLHPPMALILASVEHQHAANGHGAHLAPEDDMARRAVVHSAILVHPARAHREQHALVDLAAVLVLGIVGLDG